MRQRKADERGRSASGSNLAEFGPALLLLFLVIFFPMLDLISIALAYAWGSSMHAAQIREATLLPRSQATQAGGPIISGIPNSWRDSGLGKMVNVETIGDTDVSYEQASEAAESTDVNVVVSTAVTVRPWLTIPFPVAVPGLSAPVTFTYSGKRTLEDPDFVNK